MGLFIARLDKIDSSNVNTVNEVTLEVYHMISAKVISVDEILKLPSISEVRKEKELDALDKEISESKAKGKLEEAASDARIKLMKENDKQTIRRFKENGARRIRLHLEPTESQIQDIFTRHRQYLIDVKNGVINSVRHQAFMKGGHGRWALNEWVFDSVVKEDHLELILDEIDKITDGGDSMQRRLKYK